jgi:hypothetical protein
MKEAEKEFQQALIKVSPQLDIKLKEGEAIPKN